MTTRTSDTQTQTSSQDTREKIAFFAFHKSAHPPTGPEASSHAKVVVRPLELDQRRLWLALDAVGDQPQERRLMEREGGMSRPTTTAAPAPRLRRRGSRSMSRQVSRFPNSSRSLSPNPRHLRRRSRFRDRHRRYRARIRRISSAALAASVTALAATSSVRWSWRWRGPRRRGCVPLTLTPLAWPTHVTLI